jgi:RNAse (barnase) inhibitor barstar
MEQGIITFDFRSIQSVDDFHRQMAKLLSFPAYYGRNWDAFWDAITGLVPMPENLIFYNIGSFAEAHPDAAATLLRIIAQYNQQFAPRALIQLDSTPELPLTSIRQLFRKRPSQFGLRGDPQLWSALEASFSALPTPANEDLFADELCLQIMQLTGKSILSSGNFYVEQFDSGGMSGGVVSTTFWKRQAIPLLIGRYRKMIRQV